MKKLKYLLVTLVILFAGLTNVSAEGYSKGDVITVYVNDNTYLEFYLVEDFKTNGTVKAVYKDVLENKYTYEAAEEYIDTLSDEWSNVESVAIPSMQDFFGEEQELDDSFKFSEPAWALSNVSFWTSTEKEKDGDVWIWTLGTTIDGEGTAGIFEATQEAALKPIINVSTKYIVDYVTGEPDPEAGVENASTGDINVIAFVAGAILLAGVSVVAYKKQKLN